MAEEKISGKSTYPPPADGVCVLFLCKSRCSANEPAAQTGRGALQGAGSFTDCKVLKISAGRLHGGAADDHGRGRAGGPGFIGLCTEKYRSKGIFQNEIGLFSRRPWLPSMRSKAVISHESCGFAEIVAFHNLSRFISWHLAFSIWPNLA